MPVPGTPYRHILDRLADDGRLRQTSMWSSCGYGKSLTADEAQAALDRGDRVVIQHPTVGTVVDGQMPVNTFGVRGSLDDFNYYDATQQTLLQQSWRGKGMVADEPADVERINAAEQLTDVQADALTPEESTVCALLRRYEGGPVQGSWLERHPGFAVQSLPGDDLMEYFVCYGSRSDTYPGLYDLEVSKGIFHRHPDRLTAYEAMKKLLDPKASHPIMIRTPNGKATVVRGIDELKALDATHH